MDLPVVKQRVSLYSARYADGEEADAQVWEDDPATDVTVLARDLDEDIWTVWDHTERCLKMISFDENSNWRWVEPTPEVMDDQD